MLCRHSPSCRQGSLFFFPFSLLKISDTHIFECKTAYYSNVTAMLKQHTGDTGLIGIVMYSAPIGFQALWVNRSYMDYWTIDIASVSWNKKQSLTIIKANYIEIKREGGREGGVFRESNYTASQWKWTHPKVNCFRVMHENIMMDLTRLCEERDWQLVVQSRWRSDYGSTLAVQIRKWKHCPIMFKIE